MNINKKLDRMKQWTNEKMGSEPKTNVSDEFKALEAEMTLRHEGVYPPRNLSHLGTALIYPRHGEAAEVSDRVCEVSLQEM